MKNFFKKRLARLAIIGDYINKYRLLMLIVLCFFVLVIIGLIIYWNFDENNISPFIDNLYLIAQIVVGILTLGMIVVLFLDKQGKIGKTLLAILSHIYATMLMTWATTVSIVDLRIGISPILYLIIATLISSLFILEPILFSALSLISFTLIMTFSLINDYSFFDHAYGAENIIYFIIFAILIILISFRHYTVTVKEFEALKKVEELTYYDELTSLLNERSYLSTIEEVDKQIKNGTKKPFAVILMDVNNLKATNDTYGHRYGCHLVVRTGHTLKDFFKSSYVFHIGGDEFLAIVESEDYENFDNLIAEFDKIFRYSIVEFDGQKLIFSVARGYAKNEEGDLFKNVLQRADTMMYQNKAEIKETYHLKKR